MRRTATYDAKYTYQARESKGQSNREPEPPVLLDTCVACRLAGPDSSHGARSFSDVAGCRAAMANSVYHRSVARLLGRICKTAAVTAALTLPGNVRHPRGGQRGDIR